MCSRSACARARLETQASLGPAVLDIRRGPQHELQERTRRRRLHQSAEVTARTTTSHDRLRRVQEPLQGLDPGWGVGHAPRARERRWFVATIGRSGRP